MVTLGAALSGSGEAKAAGSEHTTKTSKAIWRMASPKVTRKDNRIGSARYTTFSACASLLFLLLAGVGLGLGLGYGDTGQHLVECFLCRHFFFSAAVLAVLVLEIAGAAAHLEHLFAHHGHNGVVHGAFAAGTMIVNDVAETHIAEMRSLS